MKIKLSPNTYINGDNISKLLELNQTESALREKLNNYYEGTHAINSRIMPDPTKPNNKIANTFGNYITDTATGYFMGEPVSYTASSPEDEEFVQELKSILDKNDEQEENIELAKDASKFGVAYELMYLDEQANIKFKHIDAINAFPIYDNTVEENLIYFVRHYLEDSLANKEIIEIYDANSIYYYEKNENANSATYLYETPHNFGAVPIVIYQNNEEEIGDYELVIDLIDAYDKISSDTVNDFEQFADAYLTLKGMESTSVEDIVNMRQNRVLLLPEGGEADWLVKKTNDTYLQNTLKDLQENIHKFANVPSLSDQNFAGNASGVAIRYKLLGLENKTAIKERKFKKGLQNRIQLIANILNLMGGAFNWEGVKIIFKRNLPTNELEAAQLVNLIYDKVSTETAISQLPFVQDPKEEMEKIKLEKDKKESAPTVVDPATPMNSTLTQYEQAELNNTQSQ